MYRFTIEKSFATTGRRHDSKRPPTAKSPEHDVASGQIYDIDMTEGVDDFSIRCCYSYLGVGYYPNHLLKNSMTVCWYLIIS